MIEINRTFFNYLYNELRAKYQKSPSAVESNLENSKEKNLEYLGTYFPRSFVEAYHIYSNLFSDKYVFKKYEKKNVIKILDIGSGTGGSLFGLIQAIMENFEGKVIKVVSIEGNQDAVNLQVQIFKDLNRVMNLNNRVEGAAYTITFNNKNELESKLSKLGMDDTVDIMQSFKVVNEFYRRDYDTNKGMYSHLLYLGDKWLKKSGILCIVDVTNKINGGEFASIIFNEEVKKFMCSEVSDLVYILPRCCAVNYKSCTKGNTCFSRRTFKVHFGDKTDESKINCKVFIKPKLGTKIKEGILDNVCKWYNDDLYTCYCKDIMDNDNCTKMFEEPYLL